MRCFKLQKGFTLVEVCAAVVIGSLSIVSLGYAIDCSYMLQVDNRANIYAEEAVRKEIEILRNTSIDSVAAVGVTTTVTSSTISEIAKLKSASMNYAVAAAVTGDATGTNIKKITVTVTWTGGLGTTYTQSGTTYMSRAGVANTGLD